MKKILFFFLSLFSLLSCSCTPQDGHQQLPVQLSPASFVHYGIGSSGAIFSMEKIAENEIVAHEGGFIKDSPSLAVIFTKISMEENPVIDFKCALLGSKEAYEPYSSCDRTEFVLSFYDTTVRSEGVSYLQLKGYRTNRLMKLYDETGTIVRYAMAQPGHMNTDPRPRIELIGFPTEIQEPIEVSMTLEFYEGEKLLGALEPIRFLIGCEGDDLYLEGSDSISGLNYYYQYGSVE